MRHMPMRHTHEMHAYEVHAHEVYSHEMHARKMHAREVHAHETHAYEIHAREMHAREVHAHETLTNGGAVVDLSRSELQKTSFYASCGVVPIARRTRDRVPSWRFSAEMRNAASGQDHQKPQIRTYD